MSNRYRTRFTAQPFMIAAALVAFLIVALLLTTHPVFAPADHSIPAFASPQ